MGQVARSTGRLSAASDVQSFARLDRRRGPKTLEGPAATVVAVSACETETRDLTTPHQLLTSKGADMAERTRGPDPVDRWTRTSGVNITPPTRTGPVTTTHTIA